MSVRLWVASALLFAGRVCAGAAERFERAGLRIQGHEPVERIQGLPAGTMLELQMIPSPLVSVERTR